VSEPVAPQFTILLETALERAIEERLSRVAPLTPARGQWPMSASPNLLVGDYPLHFENHFVKIISSKSFY
jgi:hypothetical protein